MAFWLIGAGVLGLLLGSFANVCIYRLPRELSVVRPRSGCPHCKSLIHWYDNVPVLSFLFLGGKCRACRQPISWRYPIVELLSAALSVAIAARTGSVAAYVGFYLLFSVPLLIVTFIDLEHYLIPDAITLPGIVLGVLVHLKVTPPPASVLGGLSGEGLLPRLYDSGLGILIGGGFLFILGWLYERLRHRTGMGAGDVKLAAMIGAFLGWQLTLIVLLLSSLLGTLIGGLALLVRGKRLSHIIPYGPFLALAAWALLFCRGPIFDLIRWYTAFFQ